MWILQYILTNSTFFVFNIDSELFISVDIETLKTL